MSEQLLLVLHGLRLSSLATVEQIAVRWSMEEAAVATALATSADAGWAKERTGRLAGWSLTTEGRAEGERLLAEELDERAARAPVEGLYRRFRALNGAFLSVCTDWQLHSRRRSPTQRPHR